MTRANNRIAYVDGLRAIAVLSVVAFHTAVHDANAVSDATSATTILLRQGSHGVDLFFIISGFCLSYPTLRKLRETSAASLDLARFAAHRIVRIVPPYYAAIAMLVAGALFLQSRHVALPVAMPPQGLEPFNLMKQVLFLDANTTLLNNSFWTLAVEFRWYFAFPVLLLLWTHSRRAFALLGLTAIALLQTRAASLDLFVLPAFMLGIVAAELQLRGHRFTRFALPAAALCFVGSVVTTGNSWTTPVNLFSTFAAFSFVVAAGSIGPLTRALSCKWLTWIGAASYAIYLVHEPVISFFEQYPPVRSLGNDGTAALAALLGVFAGCVFYAIAERPFVVAPLRDRLRREYEQFLPRWFNAVGIPSIMRLSGPDTRVAANRLRETAGLTTESKDPVSFRNAVPAGFQE